MANTFSTGNNFNFTGDGLTQDLSVDFLDCRLSLQVLR
jgi:hypothetical protein